MTKESDLESRIFQSRGFVPKGFEDCVLKIAEVKKKTRQEYERYLKMDTTQLTKTEIVAGIRHHLGFAYYSLCNTIEYLNTQRDKLKNG